MAITHKERMTACGVNTGLFEREQEPMICCPELDHHNSGRPNLPLSSCLYKQRDHVNRVATCYGGCKRKQPDQPKQPKQSEGTQRIAGKEDAALTAKIIKMYQDGSTIKAIMQEVKHGREFIGRRLASVNIRSARYQRDKMSLKYRVFQFLDGYPGAPISEITRNFPEGKKITLERYKTQWNVRASHALHKN